MSSAIYIHFDESVSLERWNAFCAENQIEYSPNTVGRNVYYWGDRLVEVTFGEMNETGTQPLDTAMIVTVSSYWMQNLVGVLKVAFSIIRHFSANEPHWSCNPEFLDLIERSLQVEA